MIFLDTNVLIFALSSPKHLGKKSRARLQNNGMLHFSSLSVAEIQLKQDPKLEKLLSPGPGGLVRSGFFQMPFSAEAAFSMSRFRFLAKSDPFDWMLLSQAASLNAKFFTTDQRLIDLGLDFVVDASV
jgi:PIN domain nuclease of toxin-antitoxin system